MSKRSSSVLASIMNFTVSGYVYFVAFMLVVFMMAMLVTSSLGIIMNIWDVVANSKGFAFGQDLEQLEFRLLHAIAFTIVLVKAYKILIAYAETQHINLKFLVEIAIIAPTIELLFNSHTYPLEINILFAAFALLNLVTYLFFYKTLKTVSSDYEKEQAKK